MNTERIDELIEHIADLPINEPVVGFNMTTVAYATLPNHRTHDTSGWNCGTTACIAGHALLLKGDNINRLIWTDAGVLMEEAREWLGLDHDQANVLFADRPYGVAMSSVNPGMALRTLRHLRETGVVNWDL